MEGEEENGVCEATRSGPEGRGEGREWREIEGCGVWESASVMMDYGWTAEWKIGDSEGCFEEALDACLLFVPLR